MPMLYIQKLQDISKSLFQRVFESRDGLVLRPYSQDARTRLAIFLA